jgi:hypothetical protein
MTDQNNRNDGGKPVPSFSSSTHSTLDNWNIILDESTNATVSDGSRADIVQDILIPFQQIQRVDSQLNGSLVEILDMAIQIAVQIDDPAPQFQQKSGTEQEDESK